MRSARAVLLLLAFGASGATTPITNTSPVQPEAPAIPFRRALTPEEAARVGDFAADLFRGRSPSSDLLPSVFSQAPATVYVAARASGERLAHAWHQAPLGADALRTALATIRTQLQDSARARINGLELDLCHSPNPIHPRRDADRLANDQRGLIALELLANDKAYRSAPTEILALNLSLEKVVENLARRANISAGQVGGPTALLRAFAADQLWVNLADATPRTTLMYRGNTVVRIEDVTRPAVEALARAQADWLWANLQTNGRLVYLYWPERGAESPANNAIRQFMATTTLGRIARTSGDPLLLARAALNLRFTLARFYEEDPQGNGLIVEDDAEVKLGALALACLAIVEAPDRLALARQETALRRTVDALWQTNGQFRTFWRPATRTDNENFYPGEALLLWATLFQEGEDPVLLEKCMTSFRHYRDWHRTHRNPAFIPWQTLAAAQVHTITSSTELRDWIFEMNDWLLAVQQWESQLAVPDTLGRFYAPDHPFGPPHASSTAVYTESLAVAWRLARDTGDNARQERYRRAIVRAVRSLAQETFLDDVDLFYVPRPDLVRGGVRSTVYDNTIRVDSVQHSLDALRKILEWLPPADFRP